MFLFRASCFSTPPKLVNELRRFQLKNSFGQRNTDMINESKFLGLVCFIRKLYPCLLIIMKNSAVMFKADELMTMMDFSKNFLLYLSSLWLIIY